MAEPAAEEVHVVASVLRRFAEAHDISAYISDALNERIAGAIVTALDAFRNRATAEPAAEEAPAETEAEEADQDTEGPSSRSHRRHR